MTKELNIGIVGLGTVGSGVIKSIEKNKEYFKNNYDVKFNIIGISANSKNKERSFDVIFKNGLPKLSEVQNEEEIIRWGKTPLKIVLKNKSSVGEDNLTLFFKITKSADLLVKCFDIKDEFLGEYNLGNIF